jgi:dinuclear metal center YbgI/SA1388 family protein
MAVLLNDLLDSFEEMWPAAGAEDWDSPGLVSGSPHSRISRVLLTVDVTHEVVDEAIEGGFDLIVAHHPLLLRGVKTLAETTAKGAIIARAVRANVAIFAAHTNADIVHNGVSAALADAFGLIETMPLVASGDGVGHGRVGFLAKPITLGDFARAVSRVIPPTASGVRVAGDFEMLVSRVALCGGAGDSFIDAAFETGVDVYVTSDLRHHPVQEILETAKAQGREFALVDISHWAAEWKWLEYAARDIHDRFASIQVVVSELRTDPWDFAVTQ